MAKKISLKKYVGVYYTESKAKKWRGRPDRIYWIAFREAVTNRLRWERCGWASDGWTPEAAQRRRHELLEQDRTGEYKPKKKRKANTLTFGELMEEHYLPWTDENKGKPNKDRQRYEKWLKPQFEKKYLSEIAPLDLERVKKNMSHLGKSDATIKHVLCIIRQAFNKAPVWRLWQGENPCNGVTFPRLNNERKRFLSHEESEKLLSALRKRSPQMAQIAMLSLYSGMRLGEIVGLKWSNIDWEHDIINVLDTKNRESRPVFITEPILEVLGELNKGGPNELLFTAKQDKPITSLSKTFSRVVDSIKMNEGIEDRRERMTFHTLRHTYASWAVMAGVPLYVVGKALGHKTLTMTQRYSHLAPASQRAAFEAVAQVQKRNKEAMQEAQGGGVD